MFPGGYNKKTTIIMISSYPAREDRSIKNLNAVASYADHLTPGFKDSLDKGGRKLIILAEVLQKREFYEEDGVLIYRCWKRNSFNCFLSLAYVVAQFSNVDKIFIQFEFNMFGGSFVTSLFPAFLVVLRLLNRNVTLLIHQVVDNLSLLSEHINVSSNSMQMKILNLALKKFYFFVLLLSDKIVVHEEILRNKLLKIRFCDIKVIPHGQGEYTNICSLLDARKLLKLSEDDFVILCFGFVTWYKGSDWITDQFKEYFKLNLASNFKLIIAGGESANLKDKPHYKSYYQSIVRDSQDSKNILVTGYIPDLEVPYYFCASDLVVLPYRLQMSASGPLAIALSFDRPFLLSKNLEGVLENNDIKNLLKELNIEKEKIIFDMTYGSLFEKIQEVYNDKDLLEGLSSLSTKLKEKRDWKVTSKMFLDVIDDEKAS